MHAVDTPDLFLGEVPRRRRGAFRRLHARWSQLPLLLAYHRIVTLPADPAGLCVAPDRFAEHLEVLKRRFEPRPLQSVVAENVRRWSRRPVVVTFDDGYADALHTARPMLERFGVPVTVFVTSGALGARREAWWDELERVLFEPKTPPRGILDLVAEAQAPRDSEGRHRLYAAAHARLRSWSPARRREELDAWLNQAGCDRTPRPDHLMLEPDDVCALASGGLVEIGAHGVTHEPLSRLSPDDQRREIVGSRQRLEEILGCPVVSFAYPFGEWEDFGNPGQRRVEEAGFRCACSMLRGPLDLAAGRFRLPRFPVRDWSGEEFARRLDRMVH